MDSFGETFHRLTSYSADRHWLEPVDDDRVRQDFIPLLPEEEPPAFKEYPEHLPRISLPDVPGAKVAEAGRTPTIEDVSVIVARCAGVMRRSARTGTYYRAVSSAGNRHPYEVYVSACGIIGLADGVWHYDPRGHALTLIGPPPAGGVAALIISGVPWRSCWRYSERGYRHVGWDCGTVAAHAVLAASAQGLPARLETAFDDAAVSRLIGARGHEEFPMVLVPLVDGESTLTPAGDAVQGDLGAGVEEFPLVIAVHEAGKLRGTVGVEDWRRRQARLGPGARATVQPPDGAGDETLETLVTRRRSSRRLDASATISQTAARWIVDVASAAPPWDAGPLHEVRVVAHTVDGMVAGVYRPAPGGLEWAMPTTREATFRACLDQEPGRDAAALVFLAPAPGPAVAPDARTYRASLLAAGFALGRIYLAVTALGLDCSGLTFVDSELPATIGVQDALAIVAVGVESTQYQSTGG